MKMLNAYTLELDDIEIAVAELKEQLDMENNLLSHTAGFITCSYDYVETGIVQAVSEALPFDIIGCTTLTNAVNEEAGTMLFCLTVLTADDVSFSAAASNPIETNLAQEMEGMYQAAIQPLEESPKLILAFLPINTPYGGELILQALDEAAGDIPIFGITACDFDTADYSHSHTFYNGEHATDKAVILVLSGNVSPRFIVTATSEQNIYKQQAVITASEGSLLKEVNGMSARDYLSSIGLMQGAGIEGMSSVPFVVDYNDGTQPVARAIYSVTEEGAAVCGGFMPEGGTLSIGRMDVEDIISSAEDSLVQLQKGDAPNGIIMFPCLGRNMVLGMNPLLEIEKVKEVLGDQIPWHLAYSGGEVCPVYYDDGSVSNRFHNFTFVACAI